MNEQPAETGKAPKKIRWGWILIAVAVLFGFFKMRRYLADRDREYKPLDYAAVLANPDRYSGRRALLDAVMIDAIEAPDEENVWFFVSEPDRDDHVWVVSGPLPDADASRLKSGVGVILRGVCVGTVGVTVRGHEDPYPAIRFDACTVGVQTGHSSNFLFERKLSRVEQDVWSRDLPGEQHQYTLSAGNYYLRQDIPAGNCTIRWVSGYGNVSGDAYKNTVFALMGDPAQHPGAETELDDVRLSLGILSVCGDLVVSVEYRNVNFEAEPNYQRTGEYMEITAGTYTVGDIPGFTKYDLEAVAGSGTVTGGEADWFGVRENMSATPGPGEISKFSGFVLMSEDAELTITGDLVLRLYPYAQIGRDGLAAAPETIAALSAPETDPPETEPPEAAPETEVAVVLPLEPEPAETTLEEWFAIVEARVRPRAYEPEEPDPDETTLDEWIEAHRAAAAADKRYKVNTKTKTIHAKDSCPAAERIKFENVDYVADPYPLLADGYEWCGICH